ncbi:sulfotransferase family protein [Sphingorhabdus lacus]|uniref:Sulfotransferase family protein n=1 Tax=Sphingorhabdus lacus TaxID=392610 RepID=A0A6I6L7K6_9SPHN|nr:sulfotransferase [Sphingorhabdus lacus]QGY80684.1 sulfotransferase family protein [Sphingorhabdus lacus]
MSAERAVLEQARSALAHERPDLAIAYLTQSFEILAADARVAATAGDLASAAGGYNLANSFYDQALSHEPGLIGVRFNRAATARFLGELEAAEKDYDAVIAVDPADSEAWLNRSHLRRQTSVRNHVAQIETALAGEHSAWQHRMRLLYALAKEREDLGHVAQAFAALDAATKLRRCHLDYDIDDDLAALAAIRSTFTSCALASMGEGFSGAAPIFVLGLPRSGTTLIERILEAHPQVVSGGEMSAFARALEHCAKASGFRGGGKHALIPFSKTLDPVMLGEFYHELASAGRNPSLHIIDKLPLNYLYIGLIAKALPRARIVHVYKPPLAVGWGMFKTLFVQGYPFSYDQVELGRYIAAFHMLMDHWSRELPGRIHHVFYDDLVRNPTTSIRELVAACGLDWHDDCLSPHKGATANTSHSAAQIREPIHTRGLSGWHDFAPYLEPMRKAMLAEGLTTE